MFLQYLSIVYKVQKKFYWISSSLSQKLKFVLNKNVTKNKLFSMFYIHHHDHGLLSYHWHIIVYYRLKTKKSF